MPSSTKTKTPIVPTFHFHYYDRSGLINWSTKATHAKNFNEAKIEAQMYALTGDHKFMVTKNREPIIEELVRR